MSDELNNNTAAFPPMVSVEWLAANRHRDDLVILDASWHMPDANRDGEAEWRQIRIPGSRFFDFDGKICRTDTDLPHMAPDSETFNREVRRLGVRQNSYIVVYDSSGVFTSPRAWWMFKAMGHDDIAVLNGGLPAWRKAGLPLETGEPLAEVEEGDFSAIERLFYFRDADEVAAGLEDAGTLVLDARSAERFNAEVDEPRPGLRRGHMPGSLNLPFANLLEEDIYLRNPAALKQAFMQLGITDHNQRLIFSCGSGVTACVLALAAELAGYTNLSVYDGSWTEWGRPDSQRPVEPVIT
ncbi:MAG: 3-mercaptopyruvate sulfurtransferase [Thiolinea sp.]